MSQLTLFNFRSSEDEKKFIPSLKVEKKIEKTPSEIYAEVLVKYLPAASVNRICEMLAHHDVFLKITGKRLTKLGDYHPPQRGNGHKITINHNLNKYSFLITLLHELAHLSTWEKYKRKVKPHGNEWKTEFGQMLAPFVHQKNFPSEIIFALNKYLQNPAASSCTDTHLLKALRKFDENAGSGKFLHLEDIPENAVFSIAGSSKLFRKEKKLRKRYLCKEINSKRKYLVSPVAEVMLCKGGSVSKLCN